MLTSQGCFGSKLSLSQLIQTMRCEFVASKFASHSQEVWTEYACMKTLSGFWHSVWVNGCVVIELFWLIDFYLQDSDETVAQTDQSLEELMAQMKSL